MGGPRASAAHPADRRPLSTLLVGASGLDGGTFSRRQTFVKAGDVLVRIRPVLLLPSVISIVAFVLVAHGATAESATGTVTGRVLWGSCIRGVPLPAAAA